MSIRSTIGILIGLVHATALCAPNMQSESEQFLVQQMTFVPRTIVEYCAVSAPETRISLESALREFDTRLRTTSTPILDRLRAEGASKSRDLSQDRANLAELKKRMLSEIQRLEPHAYCKQFAIKLAAMDAQVLVNEAEQSYLKYMASAKEHQGARK